MVDKPIGVGIIGASPERGWARDAHGPALAALDAFELRAVSTSREETAAQAARYFDVPLAFADHRELVSRPEVDLVVVAVKVPTHFQLVNDALAAGKHVLCEWPLGNGAEEARELASRAKSAGVRHFVGLQARFSPVVRAVRELVAEGAIGEVLSTSLVASGMAWSHVTDNAHAYLNDRTNGASLLTIPFGHAVDALCWCLGDFGDITGTFATRHPRVHNLETDEWLSRDVPDVLAVSGLLENGALASVHYRGGASEGENLLWQIAGSEGEVVVRGDFGHMQIADLQLSVKRRDSEGLTPMTPPDRFVEAPEVPAGAAFNVGQQYAAIAADMRAGSRSVPDFDDAVGRHELLHRIETSVIVDTRG